MSVSAPPPREAGGELPPVVWVLVPVAETADPAIEYYNDYSQSRAEFARAFAALGIAWHWRPVTSRTVEAVIADIVRESAPGVPTVFNLCDGDDTNGVPGVSVVRALRAAGVRSTGADEHFYTITTSKIDMKRAFDAAGVPTAPWEIVAPTPRTPDGIVARLGAPLIIKPAVSAGSMGITTASVVADDAALRAQLDVLAAGYHGWDLVSGGVIAERFIRGREFTVLVTGSVDAPERSRIYPAVERVFHAGLPPAEQFLSYDRLWEVYEREAPIADGQYLWEYAAAEEALQQRLCDTSWDAYVAVGGRGYGRIDLRMDAETGALYVLEVNAQCGLSEDENYTSIGAILRFAGGSFATLVREIIVDARVERPARRIRISA